MCFVWLRCFHFFFFKQKTAYEMRISDWSSDVCSSDLGADRLHRGEGAGDDGGERLRRPGGEQPGEVERLAQLVGAHVAGHRLGAGGPRLGDRSEERRVGKECVSTCRSRWSPYH